jgi:exonuclease III
MLFSALLFIVPMFVLSETFCPVGTSQFDNRADKTRFRLVQYNVEWLFVDYYSASDCPGSGCAWHNETVAKEHLVQVSKVIRELQPDIINLCEIEGCDELAALTKLLTKNEYNPYVIKGKDTSTGQNVGMLARIKPSTMYRTEERVQYPVPGSTCGYSGAPGDSGVSKHYISEFLIGGLNILMVGAHLVAFPTDSARCAQREAQAQVLQNVIVEYVNKGYEIIILGDFNDFDGSVLDANNNRPTSQVLEILKGVAGLHSTSYQLTNVAEKIEKSKRATDWWDKNGDCASNPTEFSMIDHVLVSAKLLNHVVSAFIYSGYPEMCGTLNSDHYPVVVDFIFS